MNQDEPTGQRDELAESLAVQVGVAGHVAWRNTLVASAAPVVHSQGIARMEG